MVEDEEKRWLELVQLRTKAIVLKDETTLNDEDMGVNSDPIVQHIDWVHAKLEDQCQYTLKWMENFKSIKGTDLYNRIVHGRRRLVALYHQEIEFLQQGLEVPNYMHTKGEAIVLGAR